MARSVAALAAAILSAIALSAARAAAALSLAAIKAAMAGSTAGVAVLTGAAVLTGVAILAGVGVTGATVLAAVTGAATVVPEGKNPDKADCSCGLVLAAAAIVAGLAVRYNAARLLLLLRKFATAVFSWAVVATGMLVFNLRA